MADPRIIDVTLDERTILWRSADIEQERRIAIFDLLEENRFAPQRPQTFQVTIRIYSLSRGSSASRSASPKKLKARMTMITGTKRTHNASRARRRHNTTAPPIASSNVG